RKNVNRLIEAYGRLPSSLQQRLQLVISGHMLDQERTTFAESAQRLGLDGRLVLTGFVDDETLRELYQGADLCLYPSLYEGFGLPILEAMRCRTPVITSDCSSMKELLEIDEARFDPEDTNDIACAIERVLAELCRRNPVETHIVVGGDPATYEPSDVPQMTLVSVRQFRWLAEHGYYDSIIHCMGNSPFHGYIYELMKEHPGTVWLHDIR